MSAPRLSRRIRSIFGVAVAALGALAFSTFATPTPHLIWNASASAPIGLYRLHPEAPVARGVRVAYRPTPDQARLFAQRRYLPDGLPLLKPVAAVAPALVCREGETVRLDGVAVAQARRKDRAGRPLPAWSGCRRLTPNTVLLLASETPDSLDGRYFGPVSCDRILGVVTPLWVRESDR